MHSRLCSEVLSFIVYMLLKCLAAIPSADILPVPINTGRKQQQPSTKQKAGAEASPQEQAGTGGGTLCPGPGRAPQPGAAGTPGLALPRQRRLQEHKLGPGWRKWRKRRGGVRQGSELTLRRKAACGALLAGAAQAQRRVGVAPGSAPSSRRGDWLRGR